MKKTSKVLALFLAIIMLIQVPIYAQAQQQTTSIFNLSTTYTHNSKFDNREITQGIDVSYHDGNIDWKKVKNAGVEFAFIRVGYRGYGQKGTLMADDMFDTNISGALAEGIEVGVYFYSQALTTEEAITEANFVLDKIKNYKFTLPVVYDYEFAGVSTGRVDSAWKNKTLNKEKMTNNTIAFCDTVKNAGYTPMLYANKSFLNDNVDHKVLEEKYPVWLAHYTSKTDYDGDYQFWQFSEKGRIDGISTYVDCNFRYYDFDISSASSRTYTGNEIKPKVTVSYKENELVKDTDYTVSYFDNTEIGTATIVVDGLGEYEGMTAKHTFKILPAKTTDIKLEERGINSIKISWNENPTADGYTVQVLRNSGWQTAGSTKKTEYTITGLGSAANYTFRIRAYKTVNSVKYYSAYSDTFVAATIPDKVTQLKETAKTDTSVTLSWKKQSGATKYLVYNYNPTQKKYVIIKELNSSALNSVKITGLKPNTAYKFYVKAVKKATEGKTFYGERSDIYTAYTKPQAPTLKSVASPSKKKIKVTWNKVSSTGYQIMWSTTSNFSSNYKSQFVSGGSKVTQTITTAQSNKTYYVKIRAYKTRDGKKLYSAWSKTLKIKTK